MKPSIEKQELEIKKKSFVFYISYFEAIQTLSQKHRLIAFEAIAKYALYGEEPVNLPLRVLAILKMSIPNIDSSHQRYLRQVKRTLQKEIENIPAIFKELVSQKDDDIKVERNSDEEFVLPSGDGEDEFID